MDLELKFVRVKLVHGKILLGFLEDNIVTLLSDRKLGLGKGLITLVNQVLERQIDITEYIKRVIAKTKHPIVLSYDHVISCALIANFLSQ